MALQGDLSSFALPDVLHLLAGTAKSGRLAVTSAAADGELWFHGGGLTGGTVSTGHRSEGTAEVIMEMLRFEGGSFSFDDVTHPADGEAEPVDEVLRDAEELVAEWLEVEAVVPSLATWLTLAPSMATEVTIGVDQWRAVAAIGGGSTVEALADNCVLSDLAASRIAKELAEAGLVAIDAPRTSEVTPTQDPTAFEADHPGPRVEDGEATSEWSGQADDLALLRGNDAPVVLDQGDGRMLPEPLPDEVDAAHVAHAADSLAGFVHGRSFEAIEEEASQLASAPEGDEPASQETAPAADERGSLVRFLSTVEP